MHSALLICNDPYIHLYISFPSIIGLIRPKCFLSWRPPLLHLHLDAASVRLQPYTSRPVLQNGKQGLLSCFTLLPADKFYEVRGYTMLDNSTTHEANTPFRLLGIFIYKTCWAFRDPRRALFTSQMLRTFLMFFWSLRAPICQLTNTVMWAPFV